MWRATFAWHTEDMDLYSINYIHYGEPKTWYVVPPEQGKRFEVIVKGYYGPTERKSCGNFLRHKMTVTSPKFLKGRGINLSKVSLDRSVYFSCFAPLVPLFSFQNLPKWQESFEISWSTLRILWYLINGKNCCCCVSCMLDNPLSAGCLSVEFESLMFAVE